MILEISLLRIVFAAWREPSTVIKMETTRAYPSVSQDNLSLKGSPIINIIYELTMIDMIEPMMIANITATSIIDRFS